MNLLDILLAIPLCVFIFKGWKRGIIFELATLIGILVGAWAAGHFSTAVAEALDLQGDGAVLIAFFITFLAVIVGTYFLAKTVEGVIKVVKINFLNKLLGAVLGMLKCLCVLSILLNFIMLIDRQQVIITPEAQAESILYKPTHKIGNKLTDTLVNYIHEKRVELTHENDKK